MAIRWDWRKLGYGSGVLVAALSAAFAMSPTSDKNAPKSTNKVNGQQTTCENHAKHGRRLSAFPVTKADLYANKVRNNPELLQASIEKARKLCKQTRNEKGLPGLTVAVSVNGRLVWEEGFGYANLENGVKMKASHIMRIASISKSMTMAMLAKLMEEGKIDIDEPIQTYLPNYPEKCVGGEKVTITTRHLLSHLSGIRHYEKKDAESSDNSSDNPKDDNVEKDTGKKNDESDKQGKKNRKGKIPEMELAEYFLKDKFKTVEDSMKLFQDDELFHKPGTKFLYTTHGWTVVSAIIEKLTETKFPIHSKRMFDFWGLQNTYLDEHEQIIYNRASYYTRLKDGKIINSPYVDNSYKWAGGGFLSNVGDLNQFANILLYSMQAQENCANSSKTCADGLPKLPFLKRPTITKIWTGNPITARPTVPDILYALGFQVGEPLRKCMFCKERKLMVVQHGGAAVGSSSFLLLAFPPEIKVNESCDRSELDQQPTEVKGVVVSMITNLTSISLSKTASEIANIFRELI